MTTSSLAVKIANKASASSLAGSINPSYDLPSLLPVTQVLHSANLDKNQRDSIWTVFERNMYDLYNGSSFGWDPTSKREELFNKLSRFILVYRKGTTELLAFIMFRFEVEEDEDVIYCYDIQVSSSAQGKGLGKRLLSELDSLCRNYNMKKIMLTVLKANVKACEFYKAIGFTMDPTSPEYPDSEDELEEEEEIVPDADSEEPEEIVDYVILSKKV